MTGRPLAVLDIDGVVADVRHRLHHLDGRPKDWDAFFAGAADDPPLEAGLALAAELGAGHDLLWLTGRPERLRTVTRDWLGRHGLPTSPLHMRRPRDFRPARAAKVDVLHRLAGEREIAVVVDDDPAVVAAVEAAGFPVRLADWVPRDATLDEAQERSGRT